MSIATISVRSNCYILAWLLLAGTALAQKPRPFLQNDGPPVRGGGLEDCSGFEAYQQPLDANNFDLARVSDVATAFLVAEDFAGPGGITPLAGTADGLRWWGINYDFIATFCTDDDDLGTPFDITFWDGDASGPVNVVCQQNDIAPTIVDTGIAFSLTTIKEYSAKFPECDVTGATWVSVARQIGTTIDAQKCIWLWVDENLAGSYDDMAWQGGTVTTDQTMCVQAPDPSVPVVEIPTLGQVGLLALIGSLIGAGIYRIRRRRQ